MTPLNPSPIDGLTGPGRLYEYDRAALSIDRNIARALPEYGLTTEYVTEMRENHVETWRAYRDEYVRRCGPEFVYPTPSQGEWEDGPVPVEGDLFAGVGFAFVVLLVVVAVTLVAAQGARWLGVEVCL